MLTDALIGEPFMRVSPTHIAKSGVLGNYLPADLSLFEGIDAFMQAVLQVIEDSIQSSNMYGLLRYGNELNRHARTTLASAHKKMTDPAQYMGFFNQEAHDVLDAMWWHYLRTGSRQSWELASARARYFTDLLMVWDHTDSAQIGLQRRHSMYPWSNINHSHSLNHGLYLSYLISGDPRAKNAALLMAQAAHADFSAKHGIFGLYKEKSEGWIGSALRGHSAMWHNLMVGWQLNGNADFEAPIQDFATTLSKHLNPDGSLPGQISVNSDGVVVSTSSGYEHSIHRGLADYAEYFNKDDTLNSSIGQIVRHHLRENMDEDPLYNMPRFYELLAWSYFHPEITQLNKMERYALLAPYFLLQSAVQDSAPSYTANYWLPRGAGPLLAAMAHWQAAHPELDTDTAQGQTVFEQWQQIYMDVKLDKAPLKLVRDKAPLNLVLREESDRWFELHFSARFLSKFYGVNARVELRNPEGSVIWCKDYFSCVDGEANAPACKLANPCAALDGAAVVNEKCTLSNPVGYTNYRWPGDDCRIQVAPDGIQGNYTLTITDHDALTVPANSQADPHKEAKKTNLSWELRTDLFDSKHQIEHALLSAMDEPLTMTADRSTLCFSDMKEAMLLSVDTNNRLAGLQELDANQAETLAVYKSSFGWTEPAPKTFTTAPNACVRLYSNLNFGSKNNNRLRLQSSSDAAGFAAIGGHKVAFVLPTQSMDFEGEMSALMDVWTAQSLTADEIQLNTEAALEGQQTLRILGSKNSAALLRPLALDSGPWQLRFLADASTNTQCWAEVRQRYSFTENGETKEFTHKPKCQLPQNSNAPQRVECTLEPLTHAPGTTIPVDKMVALNLRVGRTNTSESPANSWCRFDDLRLVVSAN